MRKLMVVALFFHCLASAAPLYEWTDASGQTRFGSRPPVGVSARPLKERLKRVREQADTLPCRELLDEHLRGIDAELSRVKALPAGYGLGFEFTPEAKQAFINDLLVHRSALITGRPPEDFAIDRVRSLGDLKMEYEKELAQLRHNLEQQARQVQQQQIELDRARRAADLAAQQYRTLCPAWPPYLRY